MNVKVLNLKDYEENYNREEMEKENNILFAKTMDKNDKEIEIVGIFNKEEVRRELQNKINEFRRAIKEQYNKDISDEELPLNFTEFQIQSEIMEKLIEEQDQ